MNLTGIMVPLVTPFNDQNDVDLTKLGQLAEAFIQAGVSGLVVCGTTGEYYTFTEAEREAVLSTVAKVGKGRVSLIAGANDLSTAGAIKRAQQAKALGYDGLMLAAPAYSLPSQAGIIAHFEAVADSTDLPIVMYNFPARVGVNIEFETVVHLSGHKNIKGIKESSGDFSHALSLIQAQLPDFEVVCGCDDQAADFFYWGVKGWISGAANVFPAEQVAMLAAANQGDWAEVRAKMQAMYPAIRSMECGDYNQKAKLGCRRHGVDAGSVRLPLVDMNREDSAAFVALLDQFDA
ncbi:MAG: 4-hydroxy-tetrahydrodipicolinate synthase [Neisseriaceae bacterium]|nr:4-hydroxy-tetrahydrodipicolinate synthase [Neisseriaceae bacterium]